MAELLSSINEMSIDGKKNTDIPELLIREYLDSSGNVLTGKIILENVEDIANSISQRVECNFYSKKIIHKI